MKNLILIATLFLSGVSYAATVNSAKMIGFDTIEIDVTYGGGCEEHTFELQPTGQCTKSIPAQCSLKLVGLTNNDNCRALVRKKVTFSINKLGLDKGIYTNSVLRIIGDGNTSAMVTPINHREIYESLNVREAPLTAARIMLVYKKSAGGLACIKTDHLRDGVSYKCKFN